MEYNDLSIGQVVRSKKGRDQNRLFLVIGKVDKDHVLVADGDLRKIEKPKKKKVKHLAKHQVISHEVKESIMNKVQINDALIRRELERLGLKSQD